MFSQRLEVGLRQGLPGPQVPLGAEIEVDQLHLEALPDRLEDLEGLGDHLRPRPVAADHADPVRPGTGVEALGSRLGGDRGTHGVTSLADSFVAVSIVAAPIEARATEAARLIAAR